MVETAALLPYGAWELAHHLTVFKVLSLVINVLIVCYLVARYLRGREERLARKIEQGIEDVVQKPAERPRYPGDGPPGT